MLQSSQNCNRPLKNTGKGMYISELIHPMLKTRLRKEKKLDIMIDFYMQVNHGFRLSFSAQIIQDFWMRSIHISNTQWGSADPRGLHHMLFLNSHWISSHSNNICYTESHSVQETWMLITMESNYLSQPAVHIYRSQCSLTWFIWA